jgi:XPG I-region.
MEKYGMVDYVMSNDSDCIACLCPSYICNFNWESETFSFVNITSLLE